MAYNLLPKEILLEIFSYLNLSDLLICTRVSRHWNEVSMDPFLSENIVFVLRSEDASEGMTVLTNCHRPVRHLSLKEVDVVSSDLSFWKSIGPNLTWLDFDRCEIGERIFVQILSYCSSLKTLNILGCNSLFISGTLLEKCLQLSHLLIPTVRELSVANNRYLSDTLLQQLLQALPQVEKISLAACQVTFHHSIFKRFYPLGQERLSGSVLTFQVFTVLMEGRRIRSLDLSRTLVDTVSLRNMIEVLSFKQLEELYLVSCQQLTHTGIQFLCENLQDLKVLDLSFCSQLTDQSVKCICQHLFDLRELRLRQCYNLSEESIREMVSLTRLEKLDLSSCERVAPSGFHVALQSMHNLRELNLSYCNVSQNVTFSGKLRSLDLGYSLAVSDEMLQRIISSAPSLLNLKLAWCKGITDLGVYSVVEEEVEPFLSLTTKSLSNLNLLCHLDLCGCVNIGELGLRLGICNKELQYLNLSLCQQLTNSVILSISHHNPSLETVILSECLQITDKGIIGALANLPRLTYLDIQGCRQLTDSTLQSINESNCRLRYLNITLCPLMTKAAIANLEIGIANLKIVCKCR